MGKPTGVSVGTQPLSVIMEEKMRDKTFPTAVVTMCGQIKQSLDDKGEALSLSSVEALPQGDCPILILGIQNHGQIQLDKTLENCSKMAK